MVNGMVYGWLWRGKRVVAEKLLDRCTGIGYRTDVQRDRETDE